MSLRARIRFVAMVTAVCVLTTSCASSGPLISDEERCQRYGGIWQAGTCKATG